ncbi:adenylate kinase isoenzyme 6 [Galendromus occidentalis]|uniref:Adenylate kinase isoenzyme 6 homolog n=1 Tax=Galendromus occidentalis TaxID=34638 RepID=A0AAJ7P9G6_9ACAR|nr:adenylate kinase isoenzyme 6 [Galendromus occidentalis]
MSSRRKIPNILVTGTPGTGKSTLCSELETRTMCLEWINVGEVAKQNKCFESFDDQYKCHVLDEEKLMDEIQDKMDDEIGGKMVDYHGCDFFPQRWFDAVFVLRTDTKLLHDRLTGRGYEGKKLEDNLQCEIFQILLDEARSAYDEKIVHELISDSPEQLEDNLEKISKWVEEWKNASQ